MQVHTLGKTLHPGRVVDLFISHNTDIASQCPDSFRLLVIRKGSVLVERNEQRLFIDGPALFCLNSTDIVTVNDSSLLDLTTVFFKPNVINDKFGNVALTTEEHANLSMTESQDYMWLLPFVSNELADRNDIKLGPQSLQRISHLLAQLTSQLADQPDIFWPCRSRSMLLEVLYILNNLRLTYVDCKQVVVNTDNEKFTEILLYLHSHYDQPLSLANLAEQFYTNRTTLNKLFITYTGESVMSYLRSVRVNLACLILRDTMRPVQEISELCGFNDITNFGRQFKKLKACSPSVYRADFSWMLAS